MQPNYLIDPQVTQTSQIMANNSALLNLSNLRNLRIQCSLS